MSDIKKYYAKITFMLHFAPQSTIVSVLLVFFFSSPLAAQGNERSLTGNQRKLEQLDSLLKKDVPMPGDTINKFRISKDAVDKDIVYHCQGYMGSSLVTKKVILVEDAVVTYGDIELTADSIVLDMENSSVYATGRPDSTGQLAGTPVFKQGSQEFESKELTYNFKTKKAIIKNIKTEQEGGYLNSTTAKMNADGTVFVDHSTYSTCDAEDPHFYIALRKAKFYPGEKIVSGPAYLVVLGIPLPVIIPYGFFPIQSKRASGFIMPSFGQDASRGYNAQNGGFYFALNDHYDLKLTGSFFSNKSWNITAASTYRVRYKFSGNFAFNFADNISGYRGLPSYSKMYNYKINWTHSQDSKSNPSMTFSANVNMSSSSYDKQNSYNVYDLNNTTRQSGINFSKSWRGNTPVNFSTSFSHTQNINTGSVTMILPTGSFGISKIYPFRPKNATGSKWYYDIVTQYTANFKNGISTYDSILFTKETLRNMENGLSQTIPLSVSFMPFNNFSIAPSVSYTGVVFSRKVEKSWVENYNGTSIDSLVSDTTRGVFYGQAIIPSFSASYSPSIYGRFKFSNPKARITDIRHVLKPSIGFSYTPAFSGLSSDMWRTVQNSDTTTLKYSIYNVKGNAFATPSLPSRSGKVSFSLSNLLEAKLATSDTSGKAQKIKFFDNLSASASYDIFAETYHWSTINTRFQTTIAKNVVLNLSGVFNMYAIDTLGKIFPKFAVTQGQGLARLTSFSLSMSFDLSKLISGNTKTSDSKTKTATGQNIPGKGNQSDQGQQSSTFDEFGYVNFNVPWSLRVNYNYSYGKSGLKARKSSQFTITGDVKLTPKISVVYNSGYDIINKTLGNTNISIVRDLHCWQMSVTWIPVGTLRSWNFTIRPKSSILQDLKYERKRDSRYETGY
jgi:hypothetical protein